MPLFKNREEAGELLGRKLLKHSLKHPYVFALPRGGVIVAKKIAELYNVPFDLFIVRKIGAPYSPEFSIGAITETGYTYINKSYISQAHISDDTVEEIIKKEENEMNRRITEYKKARVIPALKDETTILVDDGLATGITMYAAVQSIHSLKPHKLYVAAPVVSQEAWDMIREYVAGIITLHVPEKMQAVGQYYEDFHQLTDEEVLRELKFKSSAFQNSLLSSD